MSGAIRSGTAGRLRALTRQGSNTGPYIRMLSRAQEFTSRIDFDDYEAALTTLRQANAFLDPDEGKLIMPKKRAESV